MLIQATKNGKTYSLNLPDGMDDGQIKDALTKFDPMDEEPQPKGSTSTVDDTKFGQIIAPILKAEGGYNDIQGDTPTNFGITQGTLAAWRGTDVTKQDVQNLTQDEAVKIYKNEYFDKPNINQIPDERIQEMVLDHSINASPTRGVRILQTIVGADPDGKLGDNTLSKLNQYVDKNGVDAFLKAYTEKRKLYYQGVARMNPDKEKFLKGWLNRSDNVLTSLLNKTQDNSNTSA